MSINFILWIISQYYFIYFVALVVPVLAVGSSFRWFLCLFELGSLIIYLFVNTFLSAISRVILYVSCPNPRIGYLSKEPGFLLVENDIRDQDLGARYAHRYWMFPIYFYADSFLHSINQIVCLLVLELALILFIE